MVYFRENPFLKWMIGSHLKSFKPWIVKEHGWFMMIVMEHPMKMDDWYKMDGLKWMGYDDCNGKSDENG